jgi:uncharacterized membrane protein
MKITVDNAKAQYTSAVRMMRIIKLEISSLFSYLNVIIIYSSDVKNVNIGFWLLPVFIVVILATVALYARKSFKEKKNEINT